MVAATERLRVVLLAEDGGEVLDLTAPVRTVIACVRRVRRVCIFVAQLCVQVVALPELLLPDRQWLREICHLLRHAAVLVDGVGSLVGPRQRHLAREDAHSAIDDAQVLD